MTGLAAPSRGATENCVWALEIAPETPGTPHSVEREEVFVALAGRAAVELSDRRLELEPGEALIVPGGERFVPPWAQ